MIALLCCVFVCKDMRKATLTTKKILLLCYFLSMVVGDLGKKVMNHMGVPNVVEQNVQKAIIPFSKKE